MPRAVAATPKTPQLGGQFAKRGPNCVKGHKVASIQKQNFALRIALNVIFYAQILYFNFEILRSRFLLISVKNCVMVS